MSYVHLCEGLGGCHTIRGDRVMSCIVDGCEQVWLVSSPCSALFNMQAHKRGVPPLLSSLVASKYEI